MCGIAGSLGGALLPRQGIDPSMQQVLAHRGPDSFGTWQDDVISLLHWRLAVIDLTSVGHQPMVSSDERFVLCYNGEVYNFQDLRAEVEREWRRSPLEAGGSPQLAPLPKHWRGHSDTEVILEGFAVWGPRFLSRLDGMFAIALYDREDRTLHLARDRAGIKPLYIWKGGGVLLFASEAKFFFQAQQFTPAIEPRGLSAYFTYAHCYGDEHALEGVRQLEPGEVLTCRHSQDGRSPTIERARFCPRPEWRPVRRSDAAASRELRHLLTGVVDRQLVADVPVGVLLSGGVDSSILTALAARRMGPGKTMAFTLGYPGMGADYDEIDHARRVARHLGVQHHVYEASQCDLIENLERLVWHYDEPFADSAALNVFLLSRMIRSRVTVALAGEGSDELFGGYRRYHLEKALRNLGVLGRGLCATVRATGVDRVGWMPRRVQVLLRAMSRRGAAARYSSYLQGEIPIDRILKPEWERDVPVNSFIQAGYPEELDGGPVSRLCVADQLFWLPTTYLEKSDKGAMAHSLEIRVPFLDNEVIDFANSLPDEQRIRGRARKWLLREAFGDLVPPEVFRRFKRGFGVPVSRWIRKELREYYVDQVLSPAARVHRYLQMPTIEGCFRDHASGVRDYSGLLWQCLVLEIWLRHLERGFQPIAAAPNRSPRAVGAVAAASAQQRVSGDARA